MNVFTYWDGPRSPIIQLCLESLTRHLDAQVVTPDWVTAHGGGWIFERYGKLMKAYQSDLVRLWLLENHGGIWVDADTVALQPLPEDFVQAAQVADLAGVHNKHQTSGWAAGGLVGSPFGGRQGSPVFPFLRARCEAWLDKMVQGQRVRYGQTSVGLLGHYWRKIRLQHLDQDVRRFEHWKLHRVPWDKARSVFLARSPDTVHLGRDAWNPNASLYHLTNPVPKTLGELPRDQILNGDWFVSFLIRRSRKGVHDAA